MKDDIAGAGSDSHVAVQGSEFPHPALDVFPPVAQGDHEFVKPVAGVVHHDMPQDRLAADLYHGFWLDFRFLSQTGAQPSGKDAYFH